MKRFQFRLQKVLDVRELVLQDSERSLAASLAQLVRTEAVLDVCRGHLLLAEQSIASRLSEGQWDARCMLALHGDFARCDKALKTAQVASSGAARQVDSAREEVLKRRTEVESLEVLRRHAEESWKEDSRRLDMAAMDELASLRHQRRRQREKTSC